MKQIFSWKTVLIALFLLAAILRILELDSKNMWFDEIYSWKISNGSIVKIVSETAGDIHPPLFYIVLKAWNIFAGDSVISMRMLSVLLSMISMVVLYFISIELLTTKLERIFVLLLYAVSPLSIFYSQEVRMLNLNLLLTLTSVYFFLRYLSKPKGIYGIIYCSATVLSLYTHYFALFILLAQIVYALTLYITKTELRIILKPYFKYPAFAFAMFIPWLPIMAGQALKGQPWRKSQSIQQVATEVFNYFKDIFLSVYFTYESMTIMYLSHLVGLLVILFLLLCIIRILNSGNFLSNPADLTILLFFIPLILAVIVSFRQSIVMSRYLSILIPYLFIMIVYFSFRFYRGKTATVICTMLTIVSLLGVRINFSNDFKNNDYRKIISYISSEKSDDDNLIVEPHFMGWAITYHNSQSTVKLPEPSVLGWNIGMQLDSLSKTNELRRFWFILDYSSLDKAIYDSVPEKMANLGYKEISEKTFYLIPEKVKVQLYESLR